MVLPPLNLESLDLARPQKFKVSSWCVMHDQQAKAHKVQPWPASLCVLLLPVHVCTEMVLYPSVCMPASHALFETGIRLSSPGQLGEFHLSTSPYKQWVSE